MKVRVGVVGVGHRGIQIARSAAALDDVTVAALADLDEGRLNDAASEFGVDKTFTLLSQMLESVDLDAVLVLTPDLAHRDQAIAALDAGKHVLVEKPPAYTVEDTQAMADAAERAGKHLMVAWNRTFGLLRAKEVFGADGPEVVMADYVRPGPAYLALIRIHIVNPLHFMCGRPAEIAAQGEMHDATQEGNVLASIRFSGGALGQMTASHGTGGHSERFTAYGGGWSVFIDQTSRGNGRIMRDGQVVEELPPVDTWLPRCATASRRTPRNSGRDAVEVEDDLCDWTPRDSGCLRLPATRVDGSCGAAASRSSPARPRARTVAPRGAAGLSRVHR